MSASTTKQNSVEPSQRASTPASTGSKESSVKPSSGFTGFTTEPFWNLNEKILCRYLNSEIYYEAKIKSIGAHEGHPVYEIHYQGWNSRHDEKIPHVEALKRFKNYTEQDAAKAKDDLKKAQQVLTKNKRKSTVATPDQLDNSRGSTPMQSKRPKAASSVQRGPDSQMRKPQDMQQIVLPDALRKILIDDENLINKSMLLPKIPARVTVFDIIQQYRKMVDPSSSPRELYIEYSNSEDALLSPLSENLARSALGLLDYFETTIGCLLLYKFERPMFNDLVERLKNDNENAEKIEGSKVCYAKQFGIPHLLRMFVRFSEMLSYSQWSDRALDAIIRHAQDFVMFLNKNYHDYFDVEKDYLVASPDYHKRVWGSHA